MNTNHFILRLLVLLVLYSTGLSAQQHHPQNFFTPYPEVRVNEATSSAAGSRPTVLPFGASSLIVLWEDLRHATSFYQNVVYSQKVQYPNFIGGNIFLTSRTGFATSVDAVRFGMSKEFVLAWQEYTPTLQHSNIYSMKFDSAGMIIGTPILISRDSLALPINPRIDARDSTVSFVWQQTAERVNAMLRLYDLELNPIGDTIRQNPSAILHAISPAVAIQKERKVFSAWIDKGEAKRRISLRKFSPTGILQGNLLGITEFSDDRQLVKPEVLALHDGQILCVWSDAHSSEWTIYAKLIDADGFPNTQSIPVSVGHVPIILPAFSTSATADGKILIVWETMRNGNITIAGQWLRLDGSKIGENIFLLDEGTHDGKNPCIAIFNDDAFLGWNDNRYSDSPAQFDVFIKRIDIASSQTKAVHLDSPFGYVLHQNFPNPFTDRTELRVDVVPYEASSHLDQSVSLKVFDLLGRVVLDLTDELKLQSGDSIEIPIEARTFPSSGMYICRLTSPAGVHARTMHVLK